MIDWLQSILDWYMHNVNYWNVLVCMTIESSIIPFPAELIVPPAAWKAANGDLNFLLVVIFSTCQSVSAALAMLPFHQSRFGQYRDEFLDILLGNLLSFRDLLQGNIRAGVMLRQVRKHSNGVSSTG